MAFKHFRELGWWNLYFTIKLALYFQGLCDFHVLGNLGLTLLLLLRINNTVSMAMRQILAIGIALWLLQTDGLFEPQLLQTEFLLIPGSATWNLSLTLGICVAAYLFFSRYIEVSIISIAGMLVVAWLNLGMFPLPSGDTDKRAIGNSASSTGAPALDTSNKALNARLDTFFAEELRRLIPFPTPADEPPDSAAVKARRFDIVMLSICSLGWDDLRLAGATEHPLFAEFDIIFDRFNSATSYSGPAVIRALNANCGQRPHDQLFENRPQQCLLARQLQNFGYKPRLLMNHDGVFDNFLSQLNRQGGLPANAPDFRGIPVAQKSFDGTPIFDDLAILRRWQQDRANSPQSDFVFYNSVSLHDGNRIVGSNAVGIDSYRQRLDRLLSQLQQFVQTLENGDRPTLLLLVPEHGAGLRGDLMQLPGMREIPAQSITHIPVAAKLIGAKREGPPARVGVKTSYLALSALIVNVIQQQPFLASSYTPASLVNNLPITPRVSQNEGSTVMEVEGIDYVSLDGKTWTSYPRRK